MNRQDAQICALKLSNVQLRLKQIREAQRQTMAIELELYEYLQKAIKAGLITEHEAGISVSVH